MLLAEAFLDRTPTTKAASIWPKKAEPILLMDSMMVSEMLPTNKAKPVIMIPQVTVVSLLTSSRRSFYKKEFGIAS